MDSDSIYYISTCYCLAFLQKIARATKQQKMVNFTQFIQHYS